MSDIAALAADTASVALTCVVAAAPACAAFSRFSPDGNSRTTMLSQKAALMRNFMTPVPCDGCYCLPYPVVTLARTVEGEVRRANCFLRRFESNLPKICLDAATSR